MSENNSAKRVTGGLGLFNTDRPVTRSVTRALENQVVGSLFNQIDTGIQYPVDFVPTDFFNRCAARIFGQIESETERQASVSSLGDLSIQGVKVVVFHES